MDLKRIKELMAVMVRYDMRRLSVKDKDFEISLERDGASSENAGVPLVSGRAAQSVPTADENGRPEKMAALSEGKRIFITSPMVGSLFLRPSPQAAPFVSVGDHVTEDTIVCVIEAMKVMNEVKAGVKGVIEEVLMESGHPVEFGTRLFRVKESS